jgi:hypothetical protein
MSAIWLCAATGVEAGCLRRALRLAEGTGIEVLPTGIGADRARAALRARLDREPTSRPSLIVSAGFAGTRRTGIALGTWVLGQSVESGGSRRALSGGRLPQALARSGLQWIRESFETIGEVAVMAAGEGDGPAAVDMESAALAEVAAASGIEFQILRMISDNPQDPLPRAVASWGSIASAGGAKAGWRLGWRGAREALADPIRLGVFLARSGRLTRWLTEGWVAIVRSLPAG